MPKGMALLVGIKDPIACAAAEKDVDNIHRILYPLGYDVRTLKTETGTKDNILRFLRYAAGRIEPEDIFVFYFAGHGGQQPNIGSDWEQDGQDETLIAYDGWIRDDELNEIWLLFKPGARILMISDSCNSGTNYRNTGRDHVVEPTPFLPIQPADYRTQEQMDAQMIHLGGCYDGMGSAGYAEGGAFTLGIVRAWSNGNFRGDYQEFLEVVKSYIRSTQTAVYNEYGPVTETYRNQKPFTISGGETISRDQDAPDFGLFGRVATPLLNVRSGPGLDYPDIGDVVEGQELDILNIAGEDAWIEIEPGKWVAVSHRGKRYVKIEKPGTRTPGNTPTPEG